MIHATNIKQAEEFSHKLASVSNQGWPFTSARQDALKRVFKSKHISPAEADPNKVYVVRDSITVYEDEHARGEYFCRGSIVKVADGKMPLVHVEVQGAIAFVSQDASFGNTPAKMNIMPKASAGFAMPDRFDLVEVEDAIKALGV